MTAYTQTYCFLQKSMTGQDRAIKCQQQQHVSVCVIQNTVHDAPLCCYALKVKGYTGMHLFSGFNTTTFVCLSQT